MPKSEVPHHEDEIPFQVVLDKARVWENTYFLVYKVSSLDFSDAIFLVLSFRNSVILHIYKSEQMISVQIGKYLQSEHTCTAITPPLQNTFPTSEAFLVSLPSNYSSQVSMILISITKINLLLFECYINENIPHVFFSV